MDLDLVPVFTAVTTASTQTSQWVDTKGFSRATVQLMLANNGSPVGAFTIEYSNDPVILKEKVRTVNVGASAHGVPVVAPASSVAQKVDVTAFLPPEAIAGTGLTVAGAVATILELQSPTRWFRVVYTRTSGGAAASLDGWAALGF